MNAVSGVALAPSITEYVPVKDQQTPADRSSDRLVSDAPDPNLIEFALTRWALITVLVGLAAVGFLTFTGGVLVGVSVTPLIGEEVVEIDVDLVPDSVRDPSPNERVLLYSADVQPAVASPEPEPPPNPSLISIQSTPTEYAVQVGAFRDPMKAESLYEGLWEKGHKTRIYSGWDAEGLLWHCVRTGHYVDRQAAAAAAVTIGRQLELHATVRPWDAL